MCSKLQQIIVDGTLDDPLAVTLDDIKSIED